jgi:hypothetical protein
VNRIPRLFFVAALFIAVALDRLQSRVITDLQSGASPSATPAITASPQIALSVSPTPAAPLKPVEFQTRHG